MTYLTCFILGLLVSDWFTLKLARFACKHGNEGIREVARKVARDRGLDLQEKGKVVRTAGYDAMDAFSETDDVLEALKRIPNDITD